MVGRAHGRALLRSTRLNQPTARSLQQLLRKRSISRGPHGTHADCRELVRQSQPQERSLRSEESKGGPQGSRCRRDQPPSEKSIIKIARHLRSWLCVGFYKCAAMMQGSYLQSCVSTRQRRETILPPVMAAPMSMECQKLATKGKPSWYPAKRDKSRYETSPRHNRRVLGLPLQAQTPQLQERDASCPPPFGCIAERNPDHPGGTWPGLS
jgi:hypothetical protein